MTNMHISSVILPNPVRGNAPGGRRQARAADAEINGLTSEFQLREVGLGSPASSRQTRTRVGQGPLLEALIARMIGSETSECGGIIDVYV
jgi:hypothetical protein